MTGQMIASAFVQSQAYRPILGERMIGSTFVFQEDYGSILAPLPAAKNPQILETCFTLFDSIKTPSTLIAATSLAALFTFTREVNETYNMSKPKVMLMRVYHVFSLLSFCLSLTSLLTSQVATMSLMLNSNRLLANKSLDAYTFLRANMNFEFLLTRWTFATSILSVFISTTFRMFVEFELFAPRRRLAGTMVLSMMAGVISCLISFVNLSQANYQTFGQMTKEIIMIVWHRAYTCRYPLQIASVALLSVAALCSLRFLFPGSIEYDQYLDTERFA